MLIVMSWPCKANKASLALAESKNVRDVSKGGVGLPEKRPYDVFRGRIQYVTLS